MAVSPSAMFEHAGLALVAVVAEVRGTLCHGTTLRARRSWSHLGVVASGVDEARCSWSRPRHGASSGDEAQRRSKAEGATDAAHHGSTTGARRGRSKGGARCRCRHG
jgi:hypothetical protein